MLMTIHRMATMFGFAAALAGATPANAASVDFGAFLTRLNGNGVVDNSASGLLSLSVDINNMNPIELWIELDGTEQLGGTIDFNADFQVNLGVSVADYRVDIFINNIRVHFDSIGDVFDSSGDPVTTGGTSAGDVHFVPAETVSFVLGDPFLTSNENWTIDVSALAPGPFDEFGLRFSFIPEPGTALLLATGLVLLAQRRRSVRT